ncbi:MAG: replicative helicase loader/inhibitor [Acidimicrobiia bacterium]|nr:replicative helicase loader/inhibitor [Acidimicrobiia bacterium]
MNPHEVQQVLTVLGAAYPQTEITPEMVALWTNTLSNDDTSQVRHAVEQYVTNEQWFPTPASLRQYVRDAARREAMDTPPPRAIERGALISGKEGGWEIMYRSYVHQCERDGKTPRSFEQITGLITAPVKRTAYR